MLTTPLGQTGLTVSRMGLGCGGHSRLGLARGGTYENAVAVVGEAIDLGVNFIDTAEAYGTEEAVGQAIASLPRESVVLSTKVGTSGDPRERVEGCLRRLKTEYVDVLHLHGVSPEEYPHALKHVYPVLAEMKAEGKIRHIGITEGFIRDPGHRMLAEAVADGPWEVVMVGFSLLNPSARHRVLPHTQKRGIGTLCMFAVRRALSQPEALKEMIADLDAKGLLGEPLDAENPLGFLDPNLQEAAYRFCQGEPGIDVVLSGTGNVEHLRENARSLSQPPLPQEIQERLLRTFGKIDSISGN
ncbi:aldo/keto reductase [bacterium]|nr:MAG: aldo/keto reductase [bacterium]